VDSKHAGLLFIRRDITMEDYEDPIHDLAGVAVTARWRYETLRANAIGKITGA
jgi:ppGpp synthetase/RelA/SpoT-type nucleotidyltranferase